LDRISKLSTPISIAGVDKTIWDLVHDFARPPTEPKSLHLQGLSANNRREIHTFCATVPPKRSDSHVYRIRSVSTGEGKGRVLVLSWDKEPAVSDQQLYPLSPDVDAAALGDAATAIENLLSPKGGTVEIDHEIQAALSEVNRQQTSPVKLQLPRFGKRLREAIVGLGLSQATELLDTLHDEERSQSGQRMGDATPAGEQQPAQEGVEEPDWEPQGKKRQTWESGEGGGRSPTEREGPVEKRLRIGEAVGQMAEGREGQWSKEEGDGEKDLEDLEDLEDLDAENLVEIDVDQLQRDVIGRDSEQEPAVVDEADKYRTAILYDPHVEGWSRKGPRSKRSIQMKPLFTGTVLNP
jgi:hypothetical protein